MRRLVDGLFKGIRGDSIMKDLKRLTRLARRFSVEQQQVPKDLGELVALKYLEAIPLPPPGSRYVLDRKTVEVRLEGSAQ